MGLGDSILPQSAMVIGASARGVVAAIEGQLTAFSSGKRVAAATSPNSTASAAVAAITSDLQLTGGGFAVSAACSSSLHGIGTAVAFLRAYMAYDALVVAAESCLTAFRLAMFDAIGILAHSSQQDFPVRLGEVRGMGP